MKKTFALLLAMLMVVALFAGCGGGGGTTTTADPGASADPGTPATQDPNSPYNFAPGTYDIDENGFPTEAYNYTLPISTTDEVLTFWTTSYVPQYIPEEGLGSMPYQTELRNRTGVNIEYQIISSEIRQQQFSVLLASDDLPDLVTGATTFYASMGTARDMIDEGYFVNLADYREYMPAYLYQPVRYSESDPALATDMYNYMFYDDETCVAFYAMIDNPMPGYGYCMRADWLAELGVDAMDVVTYDDVHEVLTRMKTELGVEWPMEIFNTVELMAGVLAGGYDTAAMASPYSLPYTRVVNGEMQYTLTTEDDRAFMEMLTTWYSEGLIDPNWQSYTSSQVMSDQITTDVTGYVCFNPSEIADFEASSTNPDAEWVALKKVRLTDDQVFKYGNGVWPFSYGSTSISTHCENVELAMSWCDYLYSPDGSFFCSYGAEGVSFEYDEDGNPQLTDLILNNEAGKAWAMTLYAINGLVEHGLQNHLANYAYEGGERLTAMMDLWSEDSTGGNYTGEYDPPKSIKYTDEQREEMTDLTSDLMTYINENWLAFIDGSKPMSEWDAYVEALNNMGLARCREIAQEAYDTYMASGSIMEF